MTDKQLDVGLNLREKINRLEIGKDKIKNCINDDFGLDSCVRIPEVLTAFYKLSKDKQKKILVYFLNTLESDIEELQMEFDKL